jgi:hypothetical protein
MQDSAPRQLKLADVEQAKDAMLQNARRKSPIAQESACRGPEAPERRLDLELAHRPAARLRLRPVRFGYAALS